MKKLLDLENWNRKEHYEFFLEFDEPFFGLTTEVDITEAKIYCKAQGISFFSYYLHKATKAINEIENFKYRIENENVYQYDHIHVSCTLFREDRTFSFSHIVYDDKYEVFNKNLESEKLRNEKTTGIGLNKTTDKINTIHVSCLPWIKFNALSHARKYKVNDSATKITFGQYYNQDSRMLLPFSIHSHHGLVDGYHVGLFIEKFQQLLNSDH